VTIKPADSSAGFFLSKNQTDYFGAARFFGNGAVSTNQLVYDCGKMK
jgi:hypothetical protein